MSRYCVSIQSERRGSSQSPRRLKDIYKTSEFQKRKIGLIHNSTRMPETVDRGHRAELLAALGWEAASFVVIVVARLEPVKGHETLLNAFKTAASRHPQLRCLIVGEGRMRESLTARMKQLQLEDKVHFTGFRDDVSSLLAMSDAFCLPSLSEGLPYALLEAVAYRLPLLVSDVGGMAALLTNRENAILVPPANSNELAAGLTWIIQHSEEGRTLGNNAFDLIQKRFNCDQMIAETVDMYRQPSAQMPSPAVAGTEAKA